MQADMVLQKELRVLCLDPQAAEGDCVHTGYILSIGDLKVHPHNDTLPPTKTHLLIVPLPMGQAFKHMSLWAMLFKRPQYVCLHEFLYTLGGQWVLYPWNQSYGQL